MKVFITGATGYVGFNVALAFRRAGHRVSGLARSEAKGKMLLQNEITPVIGDMNSPASYRAVAESCSVLVHAAADSKGDTVGLDRKTLETFVSMNGKGSVPKTVVYTSGCWGYGNTGFEAADETAPQRPARIIAWRPGHEEIVLNAEGIRGIVVRPGCVYGKQGRLTNMWFEGAFRDKDLKIIGDGTNRWAMVHADDVAEGYVLAAESGLAREIFNLNDSSRSTVAEMARAVAKVSGYNGTPRFVPVQEAAEVLGDFAEALALDQHVDNGKAMRMIGWRPRHSGFADEVETYFQAWKSARD